MTEQDRFASFLSTTRQPPPDLRILAHGKTLTEFWETCEHPGWMLWIVNALAITDRRMMLALCACAREVLERHPLVGEDRPRLVVEALEKWVHEDAPWNDVNQAMLAVLRIKTPDESILMTVINTVFFAGRRDPQATIQCALEAGCAPATLAAAIRRSIPVKFLTQVL